MSNRIVVWTLAALAVLLVLVPLLGMFGMMSVGWMTGGGMMMGMSVGGTVWFALAIVVIAALVMMLLRQTSA
jgi:hypothetical protein